MTTNSKQYNNFFAETELQMHCDSTEPGYIDFHITNSNISQLLGSDYIHIVTHWYRKHAQFSMFNLRRKKWTGLKNRTIYFLI